MSCRNTDPIRRSWIGHERWELRHRLAFTDCLTGRHGDRHAEEFNRRFHQTCSNWIISFNGVGDSAADFRVNWVGDIGVTVCKAGMHGAGRAFDLSHIRAGNGAFIDTNTDLNPDSPCRGLRATRRYIATAASLRRFVGTVLTGWYNDDHKNHIHFDNGAPLVPIQRTLRTDTTLILRTQNEDELRTREPGTVRSRILRSLRLQRSHARCLFAVLRSPFSVRRSSFSVRLRSEF